jgi:membrane-bound metal-dependent hydrolase YbcI (DUF457 family)
MLLGHLAVPIIIKRYLPQEQLPALMVASIFPDVVDKTLKELQLRPNGRTFSHSLLGLGLSTLLVYLVWGKTIGRSWALGYLLHLCGDLGGTVPWFYPFKEYVFKLSPFTYKQKIIRTVTHPQPIETGLLLWAFTLWLRLPPFHFAAEPKQNRHHY